MAGVKGRIHNDSDILVSHEELDEVSFPIWMDLPHRLFFYFAASPTNFNKNSTFVWFPSKVPSISYLIYVYNSINIHKDISFNDILNKSLLKSKN